MSTNREKLLTAAELVREVKSGLNLEKRTCGECDFEHYVDFHQFNTHKSLEAIERKLGSFAGGSVITALDDLTE